MNAYVLSIGNHSLIDKYTREYYASDIKRDWVSTIIDKGDVAFRYDYLELMIKHDYNVDAVIIRNAGVYNLKFYMQTEDEYLKLMVLLS